MLLARNNRQKEISTCVGKDKPTVTVGKIKYCTWKAYAKRLCMSPCSGIENVRIVGSNPTLGDLILSQESVFHNNKSANWFNCRFIQCYQALLSSNYGDCPA